MAQNNLMYVKLKFTNPYMNIQLVRIIDLALAKHGVNLDDYMDLDLTDMDSYDNGYGDGKPYYNWGQYD